MNVAEYISSGILEAYVMGELTPAERLEVEDALLNHPEIKEELVQIEKTLEGLAFATVKKPDDQIRSKFLDSISEEPKVISMESRSSSGFGIRYAVAASITLALVSSFLAFNFWNKWKDAEGRLSELITQNQQFAENYNLVNQQLDGLQQAVAIMNNQDFRRVVMTGTGYAPEALATVYWNEKTSRVFLGIQNLKELSSDQQYQLWAIIDGKPVNAGVFDADSSEVLLAMNSIGAGAGAFAVTIEPRGGSENPSLETMQVVGEV